MRTYMSHGTNDMNSPGTSEINALNSDEIDTRS